MKPRSRSSLLLYLLLNILVSAATTLTVLVVWDRVRQANLPRLPATEQAALNTPAGTAPLVPSETPAPGAPTATQAPTPSGPLAQIDQVIGAGDVKQEYVRVRRLGEGDLRLSGWQLKTESGEAYTFPDLVLYKGGAVLVYSRAGTDSATELYWDRSAPAWRSGAWVTLLDPSGAVQATYQIP